MKYLYANDIHLEMAQEHEFNRFAAEIISSNADALWLCGDIAVAGSVERKLVQLQDAIQIPIYFVLGNHDYYYGSIEKVRDKVRTFTALHDGLFWMPEVGSIKLSDSTALIGHGGWGDGRFGDFDESTVYLNDYVTIEELSMITHAERKARLQALGDEAAECIRINLLEALKANSTVYVLTHVPPFQAASWHEGKPSDDNFAPHFSCMATGQAIVEVMEQHKEKQVIVLCGHTHGEGVYRPIDNVKVITSAAVYREPRVAGMIEL